MAYPRKFDHDEAIRLHRAGESINALSRRYGVSWTAVGRVVRPEIRNQMDLTMALRQHGICHICGAPCSWNRYRQEKPRCRNCWAEARATSVRPDALQCLTCRDWKWDTEFPYSASEVHRRGRHSHCRKCLTKLRQEYRERHKVPCVSCGAPALPPSEKRTRGAPFPRCRRCYEAERRALKEAA